MTAWHEDARFEIFGCECDVYVEGENYLYVENEVFNYYGDYTCCDYHQGRNPDGTTFYLKGECGGADNDYIVHELLKAPWEVAKYIVELELESLRDHEWQLDKYKDENDWNSPLIDEAIYALINHAVEGEKFVWE